MVAVVVVSLRVSSIVHTTLVLIKDVVIFNSILAIAGSLLMLYCSRGLTIHLFLVYLLRCITVRSRGGHGRQSVLNSAGVGERWWGITCFLLGYLRVAGPLLVMYEMRWL